MINNIMRSIAKNKLLLFLLLYIEFLIYSISAVCAKQASQEVNYIYSIRFVVLELFLLGVYALVWQQILKIIPLSVAMSCKGITIVNGLILAVLFFKETVTIQNIIGAIIVITGVILVSKYD